MTVTGSTLDYTVTVARLLVFRLRCITVITMIHVIVLCCPSHAARDSIWMHYKLPGAGRNVS
jgi:hypothetical protein